MGWQSYNSAYKLRQYHARRARLIAMLGGKCVDCGTVRDLQFDHKDPASKSFDIGKKLTSRAWGVIVDEARKCVLRCDEHHRDKTLTNGDGGHFRSRHGTYYKYRRGCRCGPCRVAARERSRQWGHGSVAAKLLTPRAVRTIRAATGSYSEIAVRFGISKANVGFIKTRRTWGNVR